MATKASLASLRIHGIRHFQSPFYASNYYSSRHCYTTDSQQFLNSVKKQCNLGFHDSKTPISLFNRLISLRPLPSIIDFNQLFTAMSNIKPHPPSSAVIAFAEQLELEFELRPNNHSIGIIADCYRHLGRVDLAFALVGRLVKIGYQPSMIVFHTLLNGLLQTDRLREAVKLLDKIVKLEFQSNLVYNGTSDSLRLIKNMESTAAFKPDVVIYSTTIFDSLCKGKVLPRALALFEEMETKGLAPDVITYNLLIRGMCNLEQWDDVKDLLDLMLDRNSSYP